MKIEMKLTENDEVALYEPYKNWEIICTRDNKFYVYDWSEHSGGMLYRMVSNLMDAYEAVSELT